MQEEFLHHIWYYQLFAVSQLVTTTNESLQVIDKGQKRQVHGPDFFFAQIILNQQKWAGNIEIHVRSSDWYLHHHERDPNYDNVILHVVWEHDIDIFRKDNSIIPVLELRDIIPRELLKKWEALHIKKSWINCEKDLPTISQFLIQNWYERLYLERLESKTTMILQTLAKCQNDWETVFFVLLAKNFGLNHNSDTFYEMARSFPFSNLRKERTHENHVEALFFGLSGLLDEENEDTYFKDLHQTWKYLQIKYNLDQSWLTKPQFFQIRPDNFPTIRLSQLATLYSKEFDLFSKVLTVESLEQMYALFQVKAHAYWDTHYVFGKSSKFKRKQISKPFVDLLVINVIVPFKFAYHQYLGKECPESLLYFTEKIKPEHNIIVEKFKNIGMPVTNAFQTQSLLQLKNNYCNKGHCLRCTIGLTLLKN